MWLCCVSRFLADLASRIIYEIGNYDLLKGSCQTFADRFLKECTGKGYNTYVEKASQSAGVIAVGVGLATAISAPVGLTYVGYKLTKIINS